VRIALNLKGLNYDYVAINLLNDEQKSASYRQTNPQGLLPALETGDGKLIAQSVAILEWLEDVYPTPPLLPADPLARAQVRSLVSSIACDIHPLNNLAILKYLRHNLGADKVQVSQWYGTWVRRGFDGIEQIVGNMGTTFCLGDSPTMADVCLVPQMYNALRFEVPLQDYPHIHRIYEHCNTLDAFAKAAPEVQPDA